jgi:hypothetical protein
VGCPVGQDHIPLAQARLPIGLGAMVGSSILLRGDVRLRGSHCVVRGLTRIWSRGRGRAAGRVVARRILLRSRQEIGEAPAAAAHAGVEFRGADTIRDAGIANPGGGLLGSFAARLAMGPQNVIHRCMCQCLERLRRPKRTRSGPAESRKTRSIASVSPFDYGHEKSIKRWPSCNSGFIVLS